MRLVVWKNEDEVAEAAAKLLSLSLQKRPSLVLGLAAGRTPLKLYQRLVHLYQKGKIDLSRATFFGLDEFWGLAADHPLSFAHYFEENLFGLLRINRSKVFLLDGKAKDIESHCHWYEKMIAACGGLDIQLLGIGLNGHIGFNEPGSSFTSRTRLVRLTAETIASQKPSFHQLGMKPPQLALTMGIATILKAKNILLLATGKTKATIIRRALEGPITPDVPASCLQGHPSVYIFLDEASSRGLTRKDFFQKGKNSNLETFEWPGE